MAPWTCEHSFWKVFLIELYLGLTRSVFLGNGKKSSEPVRKRPRFQGYKEDPFIFFEDNDPAFCEIQKYFNLSEVNQANVLKSPVKHLRFC
jgi:hypothetical protein